MDESMGLVYQRVKIRDETVSFRMRADLKKQLEGVAIREGRSVSDIMRDAAIERIRGARVDE